MRVTDNYAYANPFLELVSLDALAVADPAADLEREFDRAWMQAKIISFLRILKPRDRELVIRVFWLDQTQASVARSFGVSNAAISKQMSRIEARGRTELAALRNGMVLQ